MQRNCDVKTVASARTLCTLTLTNDHHALTTSIVHGVLSPRRGAGKVPTASGEVFSKSKGKESFLRERERDVVLEERKTGHVKW